MCAPNQAHVRRTSSWLANKRNIPLLLHTQTYQKCCGPFQPRLYPIIGHKLVAPCNRRIGASYIQRESTNINQTIHGHTHNGSCMRMDSQAIPGDHLICEYAVCGAQLYLKHRAVVKTNPQNYAGVRRVIESAYPSQHIPAFTNYRNSVYSICRFLEYYENTINRFTII